MADSAPDSASRDPFSSPDAGDPDSPPWASEEDAPGGDDLSPSFAVDVARLWVRRHQKASMLGAFAVGVFVGALLRD